MSGILFFIFASCHPLRKGCISLYLGTTHYVEMYAHVENSESDYNYEEDENTGYGSLQALSIYDLRNLPCLLQHFFFLVPRVRLPMEASFYS